MILALLGESNYAQWEEILKIGNKSGRKELSIPFRIIEEANVFDFSFNKIATNINILFLATSYYSIPFL